MRDRSNRRAVPARLTSVTPRQFIRRSGKLSVQKRSKKHTLRFTRPKVNGQLACRGDFFLKTGGGRKNHKRAGLLSQEDVASGVRRYVRLLRQRLLAQERHVPALVRIRRKECHAERRAVHGGGLIARRLEPHHRGVVLLSHLQTEATSASWTAPRRGSRAALRGASAVLALLWSPEGRRAHARGRGHLEPCGQLSRCRATRSHASAQKQRRGCRSRRLVWLRWWHRRR